MVSIPFIKKYGEKRDCLLLSYPHEVLYAYLEMAYEMCPMIVVEHLNVDIRTYTYNIDMHVYIYIILYHIISSISYHIILHCVILYCVKLYHMLDHTIYIKYLPVQYYLTKQREIGLQFASNGDKRHTTRPGFIIGHSLENHGPIHVKAPPVDAVIHSRATLSIYPSMYLSCRCLGLSEMWCVPNLVFNQWFIIICRLPKRTISVLNPGYSHLLNIYATII